MIGTKGGWYTRARAAPTVWVALAAMILAACGGGSAAAPTAASTAPSAAGAATSTPGPGSGGVVAASTAVSGGAAAGAASGSGTIQLTGAGSTFDNPLFSKAFSQYQQVNPNVQVNYQSVGSGAGVQQLTQNTVDFGATDFPLSDDQMKAINGEVVHVPVTLGPAAIAYNLPGVKEGLKLSGQVLADIYLGKITKWDDPQIASLNQDLKLPSTDIAVVHRSDGSGTTDIFTTYLSSVSPDWKSKVGAGASVNWPVGIGGKGSEGVSGAVKQTPGGIGYFELAYAKTNNLTMAAIGNSAGEFLMPTTDGASACAAAVADSMPPDTRVRIAGSCTTKGSYPISGFSWIVIRKDQKDATKGQALVSLLWWLVHDGQKLAPDLSYAPLPAPVVAIDEKNLATVTLNGQPVKVPSS